MLKSWSRFSAIGRWHTHTVLCWYLVSSPDLIRCMDCFQYNAWAILKVICAGVGFGSGTETSWYHVMLGVYTSDCCAKLMVICSYTLDYTVRICYECQISNRMLLHSCCTRWVHLEWVFLLSCMTTELHMLAGFFISLFWAIKCFFQMSREWLMPYLVCALVNCTCIHVVWPTLLLHHSLYSSLQDNG